MARWTVWGKIWKTRHTTNISTKPKEGYVNYGKRTNIFGPSLSIQFTWVGIKYAVNSISGISGISSYIAGLLASYLSPQPAGDAEFAVAPIAPTSSRRTSSPLLPMVRCLISPLTPPTFLPGTVLAAAIQIVKAGGYEAKAKVSW